MKMTKTMLMTALICGTLGSSAAFADETAPSYFLDEMIVTATRTPVEEFKANANVTVVSKKQLEEHHFENLGEVLRTVPGVTVNNYSLSGYDNSNGLRMNGSDEIVVLVDGVKINNVVNKVSAVQLKNMENIERIEVLKGSASTLYGSNAKGGVINIITRRPEGVKTKLAVSGGSYDTENYVLNHQGKAASWSWDVTGAKNRIGTFKDGNGNHTPSYTNSDTVSLKVSNQINDQHEIIATYDRYKADYKYIGLYEYEMGTPIRVGHVDNKNYKFILNSKFSDKLNNQLAYFNSDNYSDFNKYYTHVRTQRVNDQLTYNMSDANVVTAGFEFTQDKVMTAGDVKMTNRSIYLQDQWNITPNLKLTSGIRHDNNSGFGTHNSPSINLGYTFNGGKTNVYTSFSEYFIPPSTTHLYSAKYGNPNIKPESGDTKEIGVNHRIDDTMAVSAHVFWRRSEDRIGYLASIGKYANVGNERAKGWDIQVRKQFNSNLSSFIGYSHMDVGATAQRNRNVDGYEPRGSVNLGIDYSDEKFSANLTGKGIIDRVGATDGTAIGEFFPCDTYWVFDIGVNYKVSKGLKAFVKCNNIFDKFYAEHSNARTSWGGAAEQWWTAPGRNWLLGVEYSF